MSRLTGPCIALSLATILGAAACSSGRCEPVSPSRDNALPVGEVLKEVHVALNYVATSLGPEGPPLKSATLTLQTVATDKGGGSLEIWVVSVGKSVECEATQEIVLKLVPDGKRDSREGPTFGKQLAQAIVSAVQAVRKDDDQLSPLRLNQLSATVSFALTSEIKGNVKVPILVPVTAGLEGSVKNKAAQKVALLFEER
jgi:hypothetical protein